MNKKSIFSKISTYSVEALASSALLIAPMAFAETPVADAVGKANEVVDQAQTGAAKVVDAAKTVTADAAEEADEKSCSGEKDCSGENGCGGEKGCGGEEEEGK